MNEAEIAKLVGQQIEQHGSNNYLGFFVLGALYIIKELWTKLNEKMKDPSGITHREVTRNLIAKIETRQSDIMEDMTDMKNRIRHIEKLMEEK